MRRLNKARVSLKHSGSLPAKLDIEAFRATATQFFQEATKLVFDVEFDDISLVEYVNPEEAREHLRAAEALCAASNFDDATTEIALAFETMIDAYTIDANESGTRRSFFFGRDMAFLSSFSLGLRGSETREIARFVDSVRDSIQAMQDAMRIMALGLDYKKYNRFVVCLPSITRTISGQYIVQKMNFPSQPQPDSNYIRFCISYVIECAIRLGEPDGTISASG